MPLRDADTLPRNNVVLSGCSTIMNIPLPNSSNYRGMKSLTLSCYSVLGVPAEIVVTALAHIAHLTSTLANVLNIHLPYAISAYESHEYATIASHSDVRYTPLSFNIRLSIVNIAAQ